MLLPCAGACAGAVACALLQTESGFQKYEVERGERWQAQHRLASSLSRAASPHAQANFRMVEAACLKLGGIPHVSDPHTPCLSHLPSAPPPLPPSAPSALGSSSSPSSGLNPSLPGSSLYVWSADLKPRACVAG